MASSNTDPVLQTYREQIAAIDRQIVEALNARIELVKSLKDYKAINGLSFYDAAQEQLVIANLCETNGGPLSNEGLRELFRIILDVAKREATMIRG